MNRTMFIGIDLYYSQEFVDDRINELIEKDKETERLRSIIKEVRDKSIQMLANNSLDFMYRQAYKDILEILDKENEK